jgi:hypothetical protein
MLIIEKAVLDVPVIHKLKIVNKNMSNRIYQASRSLPLLDFSCLPESGAADTATGDTEYPITGRACGLMPYQKYVYSGRFC